MIWPRMAPLAVRIGRTLNAPPDRVFRAFLDPDLLRRWIAPDELEVDRVTVDPRVGGRIEVWHSRNGSSTGKFVGVFLTIDPPKHLVYRWAFVGTEPEKGEYIDTLVTVRLRPRSGNRTSILVVHEGLEELEHRAPQVFAKLVPGTNNCLDKLELAANLVC
ncbi:MAG TPA: SRPBCC domain-containing protein [Thermoplasmata archaeon]|nr:SRPBCC domain-containing protein [Thermoplasmata archaeon]